MQPAELFWAELMTKTCMETWFSKLCGMKVGHAKIFNFPPNIYDLSNSIPRDSGDSPDSNHTNYINYGCEIREKIPIVFPEVRESPRNFLRCQALRLL